MKKTFFSIAMCVSMLFILSSCNDEVIFGEVTSQKTEPSASKTVAAATSWTYLPSKNWTTTGGTATGWLYCFDAKGTNQNANRAVFTVTNNSTSASSVTLRIQVTSNSCPNTPGQEVLVLTIPKGTSRTGHVIVSGYASTETRLRAQIMPDASSGSFSGTILYGYEQ